MDHYGWLAVAIRRGWGNKSRREVGQERRAVHYHFQGCHCWFFAFGTNPLDAKCTGFDTPDFDYKYNASHGTGLFIP